MTGYDLFGPIAAPTPRLPDGMRLETDFLSAADELWLLVRIGELPFTNAEYLQYTARRRTVSYGGKYDFTHQQLNEAPPIPEWLRPLKVRAARWAGVSAEQVA